MYISVQELQHSDRYHCLANAIIVQAAKDYEMALIAEAYQRSYQVRSAEVERFFKSSWYRFPCPLKPLTKYAKRPFSSI